MHKITKQVRDIEVIERELNSSPIGILALNIDNEKTIQLTTTFLYQDKNIYVLFKSSEELLEKIPYNSPVSFVVIKNDKIKKQNKADFIPTYDIISITIAGAIRKVDEQKVIQDVKENYLKKYSKKFETSRKNISSLGEVLIIDTEEIHAFEETGG